MILINAQDNRTERLGVFSRYVPLGIPRGIVALAAYLIEKVIMLKFEMKISASNDGMLFWVDGYDKGWHAYINGKEVPIYRANINFKAISLPKGTNNISFIYNPFLFKIGLFIF